MLIKHNAKLGAQYKKYGNSLKRTYRDLKGPFEALDYTKIALNQLRMYGNLNAYEEGLFSAVLDKTRPIDGPKVLFWTKLHLFGTF